MEAHCVNLKLKYQNQALKFGQHGQILNETSNKAKIKKEIEVLETINIELEHSVAKLLAENEKLIKENDHLKQTYKDLYDSIKKTRTKVFANAAFKNELRKLEGNIVDTKFVKPSILGKPVLQPPRNQSVVRQLNAFKSERPNFSKPRFASQVDVNNVLSKPVTPHYMPKVREYVLAKPHHMITPGSSRNSQEESYGSNDMAHNHYLEEARKKTQEQNRNSKPSVMHTTSIQKTIKDSKQKPRSNNQTSRSLLVSKSSGVTSNSEPLVDHSRNSSSFSDSKHFVCSTCQECVFNANHDDCITKFLKEVNSRAKVQSPKTRNNVKLVAKISNENKSKRWISKGYRLSPNKWIPTGKLFASSTTKVDSETPNGSKAYITNLYECEQTLNVSAGTLNFSAGTSLKPKKEKLKVSLLKKMVSKNQVPQGIHKQEQSPITDGLQMYTNDKQEQWRLQTTLQASLLKEKKGVRFSALYLQKKRNLLVFDHSHQQISYFPMLVQSSSGSPYISLKFNSLIQSKMAITYAIFEGKNRPAPQVMTLGTLSSGLVPNPIPQPPYVPPTRNDWDILFQPMFDEFFNPPPSVVSPVLVAAALRPVDPTGSPVSTSIDQDAPFASNPSTQEQDQSPIISQGVEESPKTLHFHDDPLHKTLHEELTSQRSSSNVRPSHTLFELLGRWTKNYPIANVIGDVTPPNWVTAE
ncbi:hypothetical protein Tco_1578370 [Tanacetum coccineum]